MFWTKRPGDDLGCAVCFGTSAAKAWKSKSLLSTERTLVEESHFSIRTQSCAACGQRFCAVFAERVDWRGGDDAQHWDLIPISEHDATMLASVEATELPRAIVAIEPKRRCLQVDWPTGGVKHIGWSVGPYVVQRLD